MFKGVDNKTGPIDYQGHSVPLIGGEFSKEGYVIKNRGRQS